MNCCADGGDLVHVQTGRLLQEAQGLLATCKRSSRVVFSSQLGPLEVLGELRSTLWKRLVELLFPLMPMSGLLRDIFPRLGLGLPKAVAERYPLHGR